MMTSLRNGAMRPVLRRWLVGLACAAFVLMAHGQDSNAQAATEGSACVSCHAAAVKDSIAHPHAGGTASHAATIECAACHGDSKEHVASGGDKSHIFAPSQASQSRVSAMCLSCHKGKHGAYESSVHGKAHVGCEACHRVHSPAQQSGQLSAAEPELCFQCHADAKAEFAYPNHHKVNEGLVRCTDCHDPHDATEDAGKSVAAQNAVCTNCHTEIAGPFKFQHGAVVSEGCAGCHRPHGSANKNLLVRADVNGLCNFCHLPATDPVTGLHGMKPGEQATKPTTCTGCHVMVHGSNDNATLLRKDLAPAAK